VRVNGHTFVSVKPLDAISVKTYLDTRLIRLSELCFDKQKVNLPVLCLGYDAYMVLLTPAKGVSDGSLFAGSRTSIPSYPVCTYIILTQSCFLVGTYGKGTRGYHEGRAS
jgi:hypothetical protein